MSSESERFNWTCTQLDNLLQDEPGISLLDAPMLEIIRQKAERYAALVVLRCETRNRLDRLKAQGGT